MFPSGWEQPDVQRDPKTLVECGENEVMGTCALYVNYVPCSIEGKLIYKDMQHMGEGPPGPGVMSSARPLMLPLQRAGGPSSCVTAYPWPLRSREPPPVLPPLQGGWRVPTAPRGWALRCPGSSGEGAQAPTPHCSTVISTLVPRGERPLWKGWDTTVSFPLDPVWT